ncbi:STAS domain-containing protein [Paenibacillus sediminis]|uniref:Anti-anti-sigma factor n=1 Tax=Paenibacillus sediminis TaxID=664909 RepID=A0ABS4GY90_9BACL|nr:STAS domain-containing protein [Paenibacillus sediminis]MBP1935238.1 anti-anti-sigma factor [Paenibacillus sediminis]
MSWTFQALGDPFPQIVNEQLKTIVSFEGDMDIDATELMEDEIVPELMKSGQIEMDFLKVLFVDSSGIGLLITLIQNLQDNGSSVEVINLSADVKQVFELLELSKILGEGVLKDFRTNLKWLGLFETISISFLD